MKKIEIDGLAFELLISSQEISNKVNVLAKRLIAQYQDNWPLCLIVLNGAAVFATDLLKRIGSSCEISVVKAHSYDGLKSTENVTIEYLAYDLIKDRDILLIEDIVDSGLTMTVIKQELLKHGAKNVQCITLLFKPNAYQYDTQPDYIGFVIGNEFVVGYGMDFNEKGRNLASIYKNTLDQN